MIKMGLTDGQKDGKRRRVTYEQIEKMWELIHRHRDVAMGKNKSAEAREKSRRLWIKVAKDLNLMSGAKKGYQGWSAYWIDYKGKLKRKCLALRAAQMRAGQSTEHNGQVKTITLSDLEKKFLSILGTEYESGIAGVEVDPLATTVEVTMESNDSQVSQTSQPILAVPGTSTLPLCSKSDSKPSTSPSPASPNEFEQQPHRRRRLIMKRRAARRSLVESARIRAEASIESCNTLKGMLKVLTNIASTLNSINNKLPTNG